MRSWVTTIKEYEHICRILCCRTFYSNSNNNNDNGNYNNNHINSEQNSVINNSSTFSHQKLSCYSQSLIGCCQHYGYYTGNIKFISSNWNRSQQYRIVTPRRWVSHFSISQKQRQQEQQQQQQQEAALTGSAKAHSSTSLSSSSHKLSHMLRAYLANTSHKLFGITTKEKSIFDGNEYNVHSSNELDSLKHLLSRNNTNTNETVEYFTDNTAEEKLQTKKLYSLTSLPNNDQFHFWEEDDDNDDVDCDRSSAHENRHNFFSERFSHKHEHVPESNVEDYALFIDAGLANKEPQWSEERVTHTLNMFQRIIQSQAQRQGIAKQAQYEQWKEELSEMSQRTRSHSFVFRYVREVQLPPEQRELLQSLLDYLICANLPLSRRASWGGMGCRIAWSTGEYSRCCELYFHLRRLCVSYDFFKSPISFELIINAAGGSLKLAPLVQCWNVMREFAENEFCNIENIEQGREHLQNLETSKSATKLSMENWNLEMTKLANKEFTFYNNNNNNNSNNNSNEEQLEEEEGKVTHLSLSLLPDSLVAVPLAIRLYMACIYYIYHYIGINFELLQNIIKTPTSSTSTESLSPSSSSFSHISDALTCAALNNLEKANKQVNIAIAKSNMKHSHMTNEYKHIHDVYKLALSCLQVCFHVACDEIKDERSTIINNINNNNNNNGNNNSNNNNTNNNDNDDAKVNFDKAENDNVHEKQSDDSSMNTTERNEMNAPTSRKIVLLRNCSANYKNSKLMRRQLISHTKEQVKTQKDNSFGATNCKNKREQEQKYNDNEEKTNATELFLDNTINKDSLLSFVTNSLRKFHYKLFDTMIDGKHVNHVESNKNESKITSTNNNNKNNDNEFTTVCNSDRQQIIKELCINSTEVEAAFLSIMESFLMKWSELYERNAANPHRWWHNVWLLHSITRRVVHSGHVMEVKHLMMYIDLYFATQSHTKLCHSHYRQQLQYHQHDDKDKNNKRNQNVNNVNIINVNNNNNNNNNDNNDSKKGILHNSVQVRAEEEHENEKDQFGKAIDNIINCNNNNSNSNVNLHNNHSLIALPQLQRSQSEWSNVEVSLVLLLIQLLERQGKYENAVRWLAKWLTCVNTVYYGQETPPFGNARNNLECTVKRVSSNVNVTSNSYGNGMNNINTIVSSSSSSSSNSSSSSSNNSGKLYNDLLGHVASCAAKTKDVSTVLLCLQEMLHNGCGESISLDHDYTIRNEERQQQEYYQYEKHNKRIIENNTLSSSSSELLRLAMNQHHRLTWILPTKPTPHHLKRCLFALITCGVSNWFHVYEVLEEHELLSMPPEEVLYWRLLSMAREVKWEGELNKFLQSDLPLFGVNCYDSNSFFISTSSSSLSALASRENVLEPNSVVVRSSKSQLVSSLATTTITTTTTNYNVNNGNTADYSLDSLFDNSVEMTANLEHRPFSAETTMKQVYIFSSRCVELLLSLLIRCHHAALLHYYRYFVTHVGRKCGTNSRAKWLQMVLEEWHVTEPLCSTYFRYISRVPLQHLHNEKISCTTMNNSNNIDINANANANNDNNNNNNSTQVRNTSSNVLEDHFMFILSEVIVILTACDVLKVSTRMPERTNKHKNNSNSNHRLSNNNSKVKSEHTHFDVDNNVIESICKLVKSIFVKYGENYLEQWLWRNISYYSSSHEQYEWRALFTFVRKQMTVNTQENYRSTLFTIDELKQNKMQVDAIISERNHLHAYDLFRNMTTISQIEREESLQYHFNHYNASAKHNNMSPRILNYYADNNLCRQAETSIKLWEVAQEDLFATANRVT